MTRIQRLIQFLKHTANYSNGDWEKFNNYTSPLGKELLNHAHNNPDLADEKASQVLLRTDFKDSNYRRIKNRLSDKLFLEVLRFTPSTSKFTIYQRNYYYDQRLFAVFKILRGLNQSIRATAYI